MRRLFVVSLATALLLSGCSAPSQKYPGSKSEGVFFTVPNDWREISTRELKNFERKSGDSDVLDRLALVRYEVAYTKGKDFTAKDVFSLSPTEQPIAFLRVRDLNVDEINGVSYNSLRSILVPLHRMVTNPEPTDPAFDILDDYEVADKGARGVRTIYKITIDGKEQIIDQTAMTSNDRRILYVFVIRCETKCYQKDEKLFTKISDTFSVKGPR